MQRQEGRRNVLAADLGVACTLNYLFSGTRNGPPTGCQDPGNRMRSPEVTFGPLPSLCAPELQDTI